ncbi:BLUF domain-containing protein [Desertivirga brevis]|uniref:BLUF domain-containing protein n=1 Tax=Desertivirga brevis TaxID=2810310 RepID=UPI001A97CFD9|nr:BLUF domain-containing protein [Pedobacter sp. SYSU D00873]
MNYYFLIYSSIPSRALDVKETNKLLDSSVKTNKRHNVTGTLLMLDEMYVQLIEGSKGAIDQLYMNIRLDRRHMFVQKLKDGYVEERYFQDWAMGYDQLDLNIEQAKNTVNLDGERSQRLMQILLG